MEANLREQAHRLLDELPENATFEDLLHELYELRSVQRGLADVAAGRLTPHEEARQIVLNGRKSS